MMRFRHLPVMLVPVLAVLVLTACEDGDTAGDGEADPASAPEPGVVEVTAKDFEFEAPAEIPSGWTTFRLENAGEQEHFAYVYRLPDDVSFERYRAEVLEPFTRVWNRYDAGELDREETAAALGEEIGDWFFTDMVPSGGPALTEPGETSQATVQLEPGTYVIECYVKTPQGTWHTERGMARELVVSDEPNGASPPEADVELTLSNYSIAVSGELTAGNSTVAVHVEENPEGFMMHDVNLVRLDGDASVEDVVAWMDWMDLDQFRAPAPGHSLGGMEHLAANRTGYMTVDLEPGRYAWVSEGYGSQGMVETFTVE